MYGCHMGAGILGADSSGAGVVSSDSCEPTATGAGNWTWVLWKNSECSQPLSHVSSSKAFGFYIGNESHSFSKWYRPAIT